MPIPLREAIAILNRLEEVLENITYCETALEGDVKAVFPDGKGHLLVNMALAGFSRARESCDALYDMYPYGAETPDAN